MTKETKFLLNRAESAKVLYSIGEIDRNKAKEEIEPYIIAYNSKSKEIAKKYGRKPKLLSFSSFIR